MAQHTPAPWTTFDTDGRATDDPAVFAGKHCLAVVYANDLPRKQAVANTHLMAAAPDLLDLARDYRGAVDFYARKDEKGGDLESANLKRLTLARVDAIIAKAEGRS